MNTEFESEFNALVETFAEMVTGSRSPEMVEKSKFGPYIIISTKRCRLGQPLESGSSRK